MPMWKYFAGDFSSPLSKSLGVEPTRVGTPKPDEPPHRAKEQVERFQHELSRLSSARAVWSDNGFAEVSVQFRIPSFLAIQEFAAFQKHRHHDAIQQIIAQVPPDREFRIQQ